MHFENRAMNVATMAAWKRLDLTSNTIDRPIMEDKPLTPTRRSAVTLAEVASLAKVSEITVSRIMRNKGPIAEKTRAKVMAAVRAIGYVPNRVAGSLASAESNLMGVVIPSLSNIVFAEVLRGVHDASGHAGYQPVFGVTDYSEKAEETLVRSLLGWKPAAMIIVGFEHTQTTRDMLKRSGIRVAELMDIDSTPIDVAVGLSHRKAGYDTGKYLIERGYRRFGYVGHDWRQDRRARLRYDGLIQALREAGLSLAAESIVDAPSSTLAGRAMLADLLKRAAHIDVAVFSNDDMAVGGVFHCISAGIKLKDELAVFGFNGLEIGQSLPTPLSTIRSNRYLIGRMAVEKIIESPVRGEEPLVIDTGYEIVVGATA
jgi:LacI family transcriptional regulator, gluconate utilization system Gnt-I transcriptional repressor